ncbi:MAG: hypothetical protein GY713_20425 [Actinomycetia bacterium]|nr:hypothetical protein [Actinomycetes bacterium]
MTPPRPLDSSELDLPAMEAVADLYHRWLTGLVLALIVEEGEDRAVDAVFGLFRRQHLDKFLPGLEKLGLAGEPDAVACAKYHYLSNHVGGVGVVFVPESERKAWVRYLPPRWIFDGTALAAVPTRVARAMLHAWHGHNGTSLANPNLGFVCTGQTMDGGPGLEGYYIDEDRELGSDEKVRFRFGERCPPVDPDALPTLAADSWPPDRLAKAALNYSLDYLRNLTVVLHEQLGPLDAGGLIYRTGRRIGMQYATSSLDPLGEDRPVDALARLFAAHGDRVEVEGDRIVQHSWRLMRGLEAECVPEWFDGWRGLWEGVLAVADPGAHLDVESRLDRGDEAFVWRVTPQRESGRF